MAYTVDNGTKNTSRVTIYVDNNSEIADLPTDYAVGSIAIVMNDGKIYFLNNDFEWTIFN